MRSQLLSYIIQIIFNIAFGTSTIKVHGEKYLKDLMKSSSPILLCAWHSRLIYSVYYFKNKDYNLWALISMHRDAEILAKILTRWKLNIIRGSSTKGWKHAIGEMQKKLEDCNNIVAITNDGPKGPPKIAKSGSVKLALQYHAKIITMTATSSKFFEFNSWDKFRIPKPFSAIDIHISPPLEIDENKIETMDDSEYLSDFMNEFEQNIDRKYAND